MVLLIMAAFIFYPPKRGLQVVSKQQNFTRRALVLLVYDGAFPASYDLGKDIVLLPLQVLCPSNDL